MAEQDLNAEEEIPLYEKLLVKQNEEVDMFAKDLKKKMRELIATENKLDRLRKQLREEGSDVPKVDATTMIK